MPDADLANTGQRIQTDEHVAEADAASSQLDLGHPACGIADVALGSEADPAKAVAVLQVADRRLTLRRLCGHHGFGFDSPPQLNRRLEVETFFEWVGRPGPSRLAHIERSLDLRCPVRFGILGLGLLNGYAG